MTRNVVFRWKNSNDLDVLHIRDAERSLTNCGHKANIWKVLPDPVFRTMELDTELASYKRCKRCGSKQDFMEVASEQVEAAYKQAREEASLVAEHRKILEEQHNQRVRKLNALHSRLNAAGFAAIVAAKQEYITIFHGDGEFHVTVNV